MPSAGAASQMSPVLFPAFRAQDFPNLQTMLTHRNKARLSCCAASCGVHGAPEGRPDAVLAQQDLWETNCPCPGPGHGEPSGRAENRPNLLGALPSPDTLPWAPSPGVRRHLVTGGSGPQDRDKGPAASVTPCFPASPQSSCLGSHHEPQTSLGPSYSDQPPRLENCTLAAPWVQQGARGLHPLAHS